MPPITTGFEGVWTPATHAELLCDRPSSCPLCLLLKAAVATAQLAVALDYIEGERKVHDEAQQLSHGETPLGQHRCMHAVTLSLPNRRKKDKTCVVDMCRGHVSWTCVVDTKF